MFQKYKWKTKINNKTIILKSIIILKIKNFFQIKNILEINTPKICTTTSQNINIQPIYIDNYIFLTKTKLFLQNSPEYNMKKLLTLGAFSIYQISTSFRSSDISKIHNPEFTILEWYRIKYTVKMLIKEIIELFKNLLLNKKIKKLTYEMLFKKTFSIKPKNESLYKIKQLIKRYNIKIKSTITNKNDYLNLLLKYIIEPNLDKNIILILYNYNLLQAHLSIKKLHYANRFEIYINNTEIANGANELKNYNSHIKKFNKYNKKKIFFKKIINNDIKFILSLYHGLPQCSGVAIGLDRIIMYHLKKTHIKYITTFLK
ncbi:MAG: hypothetical protein HYZ30_01355 [Candidatus Azosocius agrarius]|nr:MAG: hypothetical protein HYZ30_01355 [Gammaproteobacteria bacterium]